MPGSPCGCTDVAALRRQAAVEPLTNGLCHNGGMFCLANHVEADLHEVDEPIEHQ